VFSSDLQYVVLQHTGPSYTTVFDVWNIDLTWQRIASRLMEGVPSVRALSVEQQLLAIIEPISRTVQLWNYTRRELTFITQLMADVYDCAFSKVCDCAFSTEGRFLVVGNSVRLTVWDVETFEMLIHLPGGMGWLERCTFMADNCLLLVHPNGGLERPCRVQDVSFLYYNDPYQHFFRSIIEGYLYTYLCTLK